MKRIKAAPAGHTAVADSRTWQWQNEAACAGLPLELFFGRPHEREPERGLREQRAIAVCNSCPVRTTCLTVALQEQPIGQHGVQGGMTAKQRIKERRKRLRRGEIRTPTPNLNPTTPTVKNLRSGRVDATGTRRRLQALAVVGHGSMVITKHTGGLAPHSRLDAIRAGARAQVTAQLAQAVANVYPSLLTEPPDPKSHGVSKAAIRRGWVGPQAWDRLDMDNPNTYPHQHERSVA